MILEEKKIYEISFIFNDKEYNYSGTLKESIGGVVDFLFDNNYKFKNSFFTMPISKEEILSNESYKKYLRNFYKLKNGKYFYIGGNIEPAKNKIIEMMADFGIDPSTIKTEGFGNTEARSDDIEKASDVIKINTKEKSDSKKHTFIGAAQIILKQNDNKPMSAKQIWDQIEESDLVKTGGATPWASLNSKMILYSINSNAKGKKDKNIFKIIEGTRPYKFILLDTDGEVQDDDDFDDLELVKAIKADSEERVTNPFKQCVCILGDPGVGKSVTAIETISEDQNHKFYLSIPTDLSTSMLVQFVRGELVLNKISKMIVNAYKNPSINYTVLIDEFHKPLTIKRVNDELLQGISTKRYRGRRFISSEIADSFISEELNELGFDEDDYSFHGNIEIPRNFGFILLSSKPNVIVDNEDLYDRMDIVYLRKEDQGSINNIEDLKSRSIHTENNKIKFKQLIKSQDKDLDDDDDWRESFDSFLSEVSKKGINEKISIDSTVIKFNNWLNL
jgi:hypothetical protein